MEAMSCYWHGKEDCIHKRQQEPVLGELERRATEMCRADGYIQTGPFKYLVEEDCCSAPVEGGAFITYRTEAIYAWWRSHS